VSKILCPYHNDTEPSMHLYGEYAYCFVCRANVKTSELNLPGSAREIRAKKNPVNIRERIQQIRELPKSMIRGFELHNDNTGYYVLWPDETYYVKRMNEGKNRYVSPAGVQRPLFTFYKRVTVDPKSVLVIVEGELNAMSLRASITDDVDIVSPGSANNFVKYIREYEEYKRVLIITDLDAPGVVFGVDLKDRLLSGRKVNIWPMERDLNEQYQEENGKEKIQTEFTKARVGL
jgi:5S rRNA maturation endonuclease (ribonuclease M5)